MATADELIASAKDKMAKSVEHARTEFSTVRTGRASAALLDRIDVDYYGTATPLKQLSTINVPEPRMITVQPFDPGSIKAIEKAIMESDLGLTPSNDGKLIRLPIPQLTEERRKDLVKIVRNMAEEHRVAVRDIRRDAMKHLKELVDNGEVGADEEHRAEGKRRGDDRRAHEADRRPPQAQGRRGDGSLTASVPGADVSAEEQLPEVAHAVAIIMDGNGRWAATHGVSVADGHRAGSRALRPVVEGAIDLGIESLAVYAFSTENWSTLSRRGRRADGDLRRDDRPRAPRSREARRSHALRRPPRPRARLAAGEDGRASRARRRRTPPARSGSPSTTAAAPRSSRRRGGCGESGVDPAGVRRRLRLRPLLYEPEMPDPDLVIRTSGERRVSNFLLWQSAYAEYVFTDTLWPDFGPDELRAAIEEYASRRRRFGGR